MLFSYNWLKTYFPLGLPQIKEVEEGVIFHSFEVEGVEKKDEGYLLDIKVLPDRAHDCLCHYGIVGEIGAIFDLEKNKISADYLTQGIPPSINSVLQTLVVENKNSDLCRRYVGRRMGGVEVSPSPDWLKSRLESVGQRSINNIVDATNYVMFDIGQPLHAFDADKVVGKIVIRLALLGEKITTLDNKEIILSEDILVIADEVGPLAIAGIKGGNRAEVDVNTKNIILESANFEPVNIRRTSAILGLRTEASKRFENELSSEVADQGMDRLTDLIYQIAGAQKITVGPKVDVYPTPLKPRQIEIVPEEINKILGINIEPGEMIKILNRLDTSVQEEEKKLSLVIPTRRIDLLETANIAEEIGRIYGYEKITPKILDTIHNKTTEKEATRRYKLANKLREILIKHGFSEIYGYAFTSQGEIEVANPLASDKSFLRSGLSLWFKERLAFNLSHLLFDNELVKIFELGKVFKKENGQISEKTAFIFGVASKGVKQKTQDLINRELMLIKDVLCQELKMKTCPPPDNFVQVDDSGSYSYGFIETSFDDLAGLVGDFTEPNLQSFISPAGEYKKISIYPRIIRDIALFIPEKIEPNQVIGLIKENAGPLLIQDPVLFDIFSKGEKKSLAFRLVFQSYNKTLSDEEVGDLMVKIISSLEKEGWEVRK